MNALAYNSELIGFAADIAAAFVRNNSTDAAQLPGLLSSIYGTLSGLGEVKVAEPEPQEPAVPIRASVKPDHVTCLECGFKGKMLKRHLMTAHSLTAEAYRAKWGLKPDHALTAPNYSARRTELAKKIGLGRKAVSK